MRKQSEKVRLDNLLVDRGICESREKAQRAILAGEVKVGIGEERITKPGQKVPADVLIQLPPKPKYVGRGGLKLEAALNYFRIDPSGKIAIDIGASTGGFTDCLLQHNASKVYAVDVGHSQLDYKIRSDSRVKVLEKTNARFLTASDFDQVIQLAVVDVSFISLTLIIPPLIQIVEPGSPIVVLIKPQFEVGRAEADKASGVITDPRLHEQTVQKIKDFVTAKLKKDWLGVIESPILGGEGNKEFLAAFRN